MKNVKNKVAPVRPAPATIVSCRDNEGNNNALAVGFVVNASLSPALVMVGIIPTHHSMHMIKETGCYVINLPTKEQKDLYMYVGTHSGKDVDKFKEMNIQWKDGDVVNAPVLTDCAVAIECKATQFIPIGDHTFVVGTVEAVHAKDEYLTDNGQIDWAKIPLLEN